MLDYKIIDYQPDLKESTWAFLAKVFTEMGFDFDLGLKDVDLKNISDNYQSDKGLFRLLMTDDEIVGSIALRGYECDILELKRFYVLEQYRKNGLGRLLLEQAIDHARRNGCSAIRLDTTPKSNRAIQLFKMSGFKEIPRYHDDSFAEIFMELRIENIQQINPLGRLHH